MAAACSHNAKIPTSNLLSGQTPNQATHIQSGLQPFKDLMEQAAQKSPYSIDLNAVFNEQQARDIVQKTDAYLLLVIDDHCPTLRSKFDTLVRPLPHPEEGNEHSAAPQSRRPAPKPVPPWMQGSSGARS